MSNILTNPTLTGFSLNRYFTEQNGQVGTLENPDGWVFVAYPREDDPEKLPQSLHRDHGFVIAAGYRRWEGGYVQKNVTLQANQRYLAKATYKADVNFLPDHTPDTSIVTWRFRIVADDNTVLEQDWQTTGHGEYKHTEQHFFVFETTSATTIDYYFMARSISANNACDFNVYELSLEPVPAEYGGEAVPTIGQTVPDASASAQTVTASPRIPDAITVDGSVADTALGTVMNADELQQIVAGLQALAAKHDDPTITTGINKLADVFKRLQE